MCAVGHPLIIPSNTRVNFFTNSEKYTHYGPRLTAGSSLDRLR
jgi:predicted aconitase